MSGAHRPLDMELVEKIRRMTEEKRSLDEIAEVVGCTVRTVSRWRVRLGLAKPKIDTWTTHDYVLAFHLLQDHCPATEVARTLGTTLSMVNSRFPGMGAGPGNPLVGKHHQLAEELGLTLT